MKKLTSVALSLALAGCATSPPPSATPAKVVEEMAQATITPLNDLNIVHAEIPPILLAARKQPYRAALEAGCPGVQGEILELDAVLDADVDAPKEKRKPTLLERGSEAAGDAAVGVVRGTAEAVIPFRGWVRRLTGAERTSKEVAAAISAGRLRRAFLKGVALGSGCQAPTEL